MKSIIFALALVAIAAAVPVEKEPTQILRSAEFLKEPIKILRSEFEQQPEGSYVYSFESEDGTSRSESGVVKEVLDEENKPHSVVVVKGTYTYTNNLGLVDTIKYWADETGYHADGESIPKPVELSSVSRQ